MCMHVHGQYVEYQFGCALVIVHEHKYGYCIVEMQNGNYTMEMYSANCKMEMKNA
jgi:hypothetical protein